MSDYERLLSVFREFRIPVRVPPIEPCTAYSARVEIDAMIEINCSSNLDGLTLFFRKGRYVACETATWRCVRDGEEGGKWMRDKREGE